MTGPTDWIHVDTGQSPGPRHHVQVFATAAASDAWHGECNNPATELKSPSALEVRGISICLCRRVRCQ